MALKLGWATEVPIPHRLAKFEAGSYLAGGVSGRSVFGIIIQDQFFPRPVSFLGPLDLFRFSRFRGGGLLLYRRSPVFLEGGLPPYLCLPFFFICGARQASICFYFCSEGAGRHFAVLLAAAGPTSFLSIYFYYDKNIYHKYTTNFNRII